MAVRRRHLLFTTLLGVAVCCYLAFVAFFALEPAVVVKSFGAPREGPGGRIDVYAEVISIDPINDRMRMRLSFTPDKSLQGRRLGTPARDLVIRIGDGTTDQEIVLRSGQPIPSQMVDADLNEGAIMDYPLDRFTAKLNLDAVEEASDTDPSLPQSLKVNVLVWEAVSGWSVRTIPASETQAGPVNLSFRIQRTVAVRFLVLGLYAAMAVFATAALAVAAALVLERRKLEIGLGSMLSTMLFSLPAMRYGLPGAPPLGVRADLMVYLWAQISVAVSLFLFLGTWIRGEPKA